LSLLAFRPSLNSPGVFDDSPDHASSVWGVYTTKEHKRSGVDLYYLGIDRKTSTFQAGSGREQRQTVGVRFADVRGGWDQDSEAAFQLGAFAGRPIRAWTATTYAGYTFTGSSQMKYRTAVDAGVASGNHNPSSGSFGTFNALFPKGAYFGYANFVGPYNVQVIRPSLRITSPSERLIVWPTLSCSGGKVDEMECIPSPLYWYNRVLLGMPST
jgi:hypothetical protein